MNVTKARNGELSEDGELSPATADVAYILAGNEDAEEVHELSSGLLVPKYIWKQLYKYQRVGVKWLWELHRVESGGLLGDEMGLGKTIQIIAFMGALARTRVGKWGGLGPSLVVAPATLVYQWVAQFHYWVPGVRVAALHASGSSARAGGKGRARLVRDVHRARGVLVLTYAGAVQMARLLLPLRWHCAVLDEGHKIRNADTQVSKVVRRLDTPHRLLVTGSPLQNNLQELWSLFEWVRPGLLGTQPAFTEHFAVPITQGGYANATSLQEVTALEIAKSLKDIITPYMLRRTKAEVQEHIQLPSKSEQVLFCSLSPEQRDLYLGYLMAGTVRSILDRENKYGDPLRAKILVAISTLRKICNHPDLYLYETADDAQALDEENFGYWKRSGKMTVVHSLLKIWKKQGHRALIFSQSRAMLCIIEQLLVQNKYKYLKMDGTVSVGMRQNIIKTFNENSEYLVFLATTRVGGLGVNLTGADRVLLYDPDWNPATDAQARERAWRLGQRRPVRVYRLLAAGTIEEKIYQRQVFKHLLSNRVLVDPKQKNLLSTSTLQGLFTLEEPNKDGDTETSSIFKHTKVDLKEKQSTVEVEAAKRIAEMRKKAKEISQRIAQSVKRKSNDETIDPRERYKKKRDFLLNPPKVEEPEANRIDGTVTEEPFEVVLSELDIVNRHSKENYVENLLKEALQKESEASECAGSSSSSSSGGTELALAPASQREREPEARIENVVAVKKIKTKSKKKHKHDRVGEGEAEGERDVLRALFAKSGVQSALQHEAVVGAGAGAGLRAREEALRDQQRAAHAARQALCALRKSLKPI